MATSVTIVNYQTTDELTEGRSYTAQLLFVTDEYCTDQLELSRTSLESLKVDGVPVIPPKGTDFSGFIAGEQVESADSQAFLQTVEYGAISRQDRATIEADPINTKGTIYRRAVSLSWSPAGANTGSGATSLPFWRAHAPYSVQEWYPVFENAINHEQRSDVPMVFGGVGPNVANMFGDRSQADYVWADANMNLVGYNAPGRELGKFDRGLPRNAIGDPFDNIITVEVGLETHKFTLYQPGFSQGLLDLSLNIGSVNSEDITFQLKGWGTIFRYKKRTARIRAAFFDHHTLVTQNNQLIPYFSKNYEFQINPRGHDVGVDHTGRFQKAEPGDADQYDGLIGALLPGRTGKQLTLGSKAELVLGNLDEEGEAVSNLHTAWWLREEQDFSSGELLLIDGDKIKQL